MLYNTCPTYYHGVAGSTSYIDYIIIPRSFYIAGHVRKCQKFRHLGDRLQLVQAARRIDHHPVCALVENNLRYEGAERDQRVRWDFDALVRSWLQGSQRQDFLRALDQWVVCAKPEP
eukprot:4166421-Pyramimonas_sp.AAC.1